MCPGDSPSGSNASACLRVKFLSKACRQHNRAAWLARFPGGQPRWERCQFIFDPDCRDYDWLVVYDDLPSESPRDQEVLACPRAHTLLITTEPSTIKVYGRAYTQQFGWVLTSQEAWALAHPRAIRCQPGLIWYYGATGHGDAQISPRGSYDAVARHVPQDKTRLVATVCSTKQQWHTLHRERVRFVRRLQAALPELDVFGHGWNYLPDKADALDPYRFHLAIENHVCPHHWTEKLADAFLGACVPFYHGCPNYADYFPAESVIPINIHDFAGSLETIRRAIRDREDEKRRTAVLESRRRYLERYWLFAQVARLIQERHPADGVAAARPEILWGRRGLRSRSPRVALEDGWQKLRVFLRHRLIRAWTPGIGQRR